MYSGSPAPAPFPGAASPAPAPFPSPHSAAMGQAPSPAPMPMPMPTAGERASCPSSSEEEESETEHEQDYQHQTMASPCPAPAPVPMPMSTPEAEAFETVASPENINVSYETETHLQGYHQDAPNPAIEVPPTATPGTPNKHHDNQHSENLVAAAALIQTLDASYARANAENATTALDADEARSAARTAAEIVRRYTTRSHPRAITSGLSSFGTSRSPMGSTSASPSAHYFAHPTSAENRSFDSNNNNNTTPTRPRYYPKTPSSAAERFAQSNAEDTLALSLELERTKQALEAAQMAHDDTKNILAEERSKNSHLQRKLHTLEGSLEHQVLRGRSGLEAELEQATLRMEAAEEDAQLALDFAKESEENRDQMEVMLEQALTEIQSLRETVYQHEQYQQYYHQQYQNTGGEGDALPPVAEDETSQESSAKESEQEQETVEDRDMEEDSSAKSVRFSDPISYSNSPTPTNNDNDSDNQPEIVQPEIIEQPPPPHDEVVTPTKPSRDLVSAGRKLLQLSHSKSKKSSSSSSSSPTATTSPFKFDFSPEKAAERRRQLREQMKQLDAAVVIRTPSSTERSPFSKQWQQESATKTNKMLEAAKTAMEILQASGKRLELDGHWWRETTINSAGEESEEIPLDSLARQYCQSVEVSTDGYAKDFCLAFEEHRRSILPFFCFLLCAVTG